MKPEGSEQVVYVCKEHGAAANEYGQATCAQTGTHTMVPIPRWMSDHWEALEGRIAELKAALHWYAYETEHDDCCNDYGKRALEALAPAEAVEEPKP